MTFLTRRAAWERFGLCDSQQTDRLAELGMRLAVRVGHVVYPAMEWEHQHREIRARIGQQTETPEDGFVHGACTGSAE